VRNARQFVIFATALAGHRILLVPRLIARLGPYQTLRTLTNLWRGTRRQVRSLAVESYWSRGPILWGDAGPARYLLRPAQDTGAAVRPQQTANYLREELVQRLRRGDVRFDLFLQPFVSERATPIEDFSVTWKERKSRPVRVASLTIPQQDIDAPQERAAEMAVDQLSFNPWYTPDDFRPLGNMNRARKAAYRASAAHRLGRRFYEEPPLRNVVVARLARWAFAFINRYVSWHRLPSWRMSLFNLAIFRDVLREQNLINLRAKSEPFRPCPAPGPIPESVKTARTYDGTFNDLSEPSMGCAGSAFGRNMAPAYLPKTFDNPDPIRVSRELLTRTTFLPAESLNMLAAAWIQFQVHDWVNHARFDLGTKGEDVVLPLASGEQWQNHKTLAPESVMRIAGNKTLGFAEGGCPIFSNAATPWWDGSEVYGADEQRAAQLRAGAYIRLDNGYLPADIEGLNITGFNESWWLGLSAMHTLFAREHNVVCKELQTAYPTWPDERVYQTARLIVSALIAKIHTVEWTPAILATKAAEQALRSNWYGAPRDWLSQLAAWFYSEHSMKGIPGSKPDHHGVPYSLTEEFVSVYRMHPLIPDDYAFVSTEDGRLLESCTFPQIQGRVTDARMRALGLPNVLYSFGVAHPGAIKLHNFPRSLQRLERTNGELIDLSVVDIVRDRRRGIPRYNDFREALHLPRARNWSEFSNNTDTQHKLRELYGSPDMVDTMIGMYAEELPKGFGFSDTAFRIFILMASRRLQSDRFLTVDYRPEIYSPLGIDWIANNGMTSVLLRHCPELARALAPTGNAFAPFRSIAA
jgi:hypothetical protein